MSDKRSLNKLAMDAVKQLTKNSDALRVKIHRDKCKTTIIDCGIEVPGSLEAGRLASEACMGGLGTVAITTTAVGEHFFPAAQVTTDAPALACLGAQVAGWSIKVDDFFALGSGPARALARVENKLFDHLHYTDSHKEAVLLLETRTIPGRNGLPSCTSVHPMRKLRSGSLNTIFRLKNLLEKKCFHEIQE